MTKEFGNMSQTIRIFWLFFALSYEITNSKNWPVDFCSRKDCTGRYHMLESKNSNIFLSTTFGAGSSFFFDSRRNIWNFFYDFLVETYILSREWQHLFRKTRKRKGQHSSIISSSNNLKSISFGSEPRLEIMNIERL